MASLHKDPRGRSPFWYCAYTLPTGRRVFKSTKETSREKAEQFRLGVDRAARLARSDNLTESRAREIISEIVENVTGEPIMFYTAEDWLRGQWLEGKRKAKADGTHVKYKRTIESFLAFIGPKAKKNLNQVTARDVQRFRDSELESGKHPNTCDWLLKHLRMAFRAAHRHGYIPTNPADAVELLNSKDSDGEKGTFDIQQIRALLKASAGEWRGVVMIGFYTGMRLRDIVWLTWSAVDLEKQTISFRQKKTSKPVVIPIHEQLLSYLLELPAADSGRDFLFPSLAAKKTSGKSGLSMSFARLMAKAKIQREVARKATGQGRNVHALSFHSMRHTFNSILANARVAQELRQKLTGHSSANENQRYTHHELETLRSAIKELPSV